MTASPEFFDIPKPNVYGINTKFPTPEEMSANNAVLIEIIHNANNKLPVREEKTPATNPILNGSVIPLVDSVPSSPISVDTSILDKKVDTTLSAGEDSRSKLADGDGGKTVSTPVVQEEKPVGKEREPSVGEKAYLTGLRFGGFGFKRTFDPNFVDITTDSKSVKRRGLLTVTLGRYGKVTDLDTYKVRLRSPQFDFMGEEGVGEDLFLQRIRFAPFLLGTLNAKMSEKGNRISVVDLGFLQMLNDTYKKFYGEDLGKVYEDTTTELVSRHGTERVTRKVPVIEVKNLERVYRNLFDNLGVQGLLFANDLPGNPNRQHS